MKKDDIQRLIEISLDDAYGTDAYFEFIKAKGIEDLQQDILKNIKCSHCGWCCSKCNVLLTEEDIISLCKYLKCEFNEFYDKYMDKETIINYLAFPCPFLDRDGNLQCKVYEVRPKACRIFPFNAFLLNIDPCEIGKKILGIIDGTISQKMSIKLKGKELREFKEKLKKDKMMADHKIEIYNKLDFLLPQFNEECGHMAAVIDKEMLQKIEKELRKSKV